MKKFIISSIAAMVVFAGAYASAATAEDMGTMTIKAGVPASYIMGLQKNLNVCANATPALVADGKYGAKTTAAVKAFQMSTPGLTVDGKAGNMTKAALAAKCSGSTTTTTTSGALCPNGMTLASNCTLYPLSTGITTGTAGSITTTQLSTYTSQNVAKGAVDKMVSEFKIKATGSDIKITSVGVKLGFTGTGSARLEKYLNSVSIFNGNTKLGEIAASAFTQESSANVYSANVVFNNSAIISAGTEQRFSIAINALPEIDSANLLAGSNVWTATVNQIRYSDGTGAILIDSSTTPAQTFQFTALSSSVNTEAQFSLDSSNPRASSTRVDTGSNTNGVVLLKGTLKAQGTDLYVDDMQVKLTATTTAGTVKVSDIVSNVKLNIGGSEYSVSPTTFTACTVADNVAGAPTTDAACTVTFYDVNYAKISKDSTASFTITADVKNINAGYFDEGDTLKAEVSSTEYNATRIEDANRDVLATAKRTGSSLGEAMSFYVKGITTEFLSSSTSVTANTGANDDTGLFNIKFKVTANGGDIFIPRTVPAGWYSVTSGTATAVLSDDTGATQGASATSFKIANGTSEEFTLSIQRTGTAGLIRGVMESITWSANGDDAVYEGAYTTSNYNFDQYKTAYSSLN